MHADVSRKIMAIGAHADDIEVHAGGTLLKYYALGYAITYVMATNNMSGSVSVLEGGRVRTIEPCEGPALMMARRKAECAEAARVVGAEPIHLNHPQRHYNGPNGKETLAYGCTRPDEVLPGTATILTAGENPACIVHLADLILSENPECILTHGVSQRNIEHFATSLLVTNAFWQAVDRGFQGGLLHWREGFTHFGDLNSRWETFVDYTPLLDRKMEWIGIHRCQMPMAHLPDFGHRILSQWYGRACGVGAAECYTWVRRPVRTEEILSGKPQPEYGELMLELIQNSH